MRNDSYDLQYFLIFIIRNQKTCTKLKLVVITVHDLSLVSIFTFDHLFTKHIEVALGQSKLQALHTLFSPNNRPQI